MIPTVLKLLRSRRVAIWLLSGLSVWAVAGTFVGMNVYASPLFVVGCVWTGLSTGVCAWERTRAARALWRRTSPRRPVEGAPSSKAGISLALDSDVVAARPAVAATLASLGLRVRGEADVVEASSGRWGVLGSPMFHWALALLIVVTGAGRLTRSEGYLPVVPGEPATDAAASYRAVSSGPFFPGFPSRVVSVSDLRTDFVDAQGVSRGASPVVTVSDGERVLAAGRVFPNSPLTYGDTMIHMDSAGLRVRVSIESSTGAPVAEANALVDPVEGASRTTTATFSLGGGDTGPLRLQVAALNSAAHPEAAFLLQDAETGATILAETVKDGGSVTAPTGQRLVFHYDGQYALLSVVHDWSVPYLYALSGMAIVALSASVLTRYRRVVVRLSPEAGGVRIEAWARDARGSEYFCERVAAALGALPGARIEDTSGEERG